MFQSLVKQELFVKNDQELLEFQPLIVHQEG